MPQSLSQIYIHLIFHAKSDAPVLRASELERLHEYIGALLNSADCHSICVGGMPDHVHALFRLSRMKTIAEVVELVKRQSTKWLKGVSFYYNTFAWQGGYAAYSVSSSVVDKTIKYINNQSTHHRKTTFREEYLLFLQQYKVEYNEEYLFND